MQALLILLYAVLTASGGPVRSFSLVMGRRMSREQWVAAVLSLILPGLGHVYAGRAKRGLVLFSGVAVVETLMVAYAFQPSTRIGLPIILAAVGFSTTLTLYVLIDAYRSAKAWNLQHDAPKLPPWRRSVLIVAALLFLLLIDVLINPTDRIELFVIRNIAQAFFIPSGSMEPTLAIGDRVLVSKFTYHFGPVRRGDVIVFHYPLNPGKDFVKRVVALGGETVELRDGVIRINGRLLTEAYATPSGPIRSCSGSYGPAVVPADSLFVLGDNWCKSEDSRSFGFVPRGSLVGKVTKIYYPFDRSGPVQ